MKKKAIICLTGVKLTPVKRTFTAGQVVTYIQHDGRTYKMNAAAGALRQLAEGYEIICTGYQASDERIACEALGLPEGRYHLADLTDKTQAEHFARAVRHLQQELDLPVWVVHYGGASDTKTKLPNNSLLAHTWEMRAEAIPDLVENNCVTLLHLLQSLKTAGVFDAQAFTKVVVISAAAAVRAKQSLGLDVAQKAAGHGLVRTLALDLTPEHIYLTEIMPGSTDSGFFDNDYSLETAVEITRNLGYDNSPETYPVFTAEQIGDAVKYTLDANCNVREIVLLPYGQFPHLGA